VAEEFATLYGMKETVAALLQLPIELGSKGGGPVRVGLAKAADLLRGVIHDAAPILTGNLQANVYMVRDRNPHARGATERYFVGIRTGHGKFTRNRLNRRLGRVGQSYATRGNAWYWWLLEFGFDHKGGTRIQKAFMRPAFERYKVTAVRLFEDYFRGSVEAAVARARRQAGATA
jgi:hypothetical protein